LSVPAKVLQFSSMVNLNNIVLINLILRIVPPTSNIFFSMLVENYKPLFDLGNQLHLVHSRVLYGTIALFSDFSYLWKIWKDYRWIFVIFILWVFLFCDLELFSIWSIIAKPKSVPWGCFLFFSIRCKQLLSILLQVVDLVDADSI
jgi:hypothetical protein